jgi:hypothetical protein
VVAEESSSDGSIPYGNILVVIGLSCIIQERITLIATCNHNEYGDKLKNI